MTSKLSKLMLALLALAPALASAEVPATVSFSARVADNGRPLTGSHTFVFKFWDCDGSDTTTCVADADGAPSANVLWRETQTVDVKDGVVSVVLGADDGVASGTGVDNTFLGYAPTLFTGAKRWLEVSMDGTAFGPRMAVHSVPFAFRARGADTANNVECSGACVQSGEIESVAASKISGTVAAASVANDVQCSGTCVADAEIATVSGSKVSGYVANATSASNATLATYAYNLYDSTTGAIASLASIRNAGGTPNSSSNNVDWSRLKGIPTGFLDGADLGAYYCYTTSTYGYTYTYNTYAAATATCAAGYYAVGGGAYWSYDPGYLVATYPSGTTGWYARGINFYTNGYYNYLYVYVKCCQTY